MKLYASKLGIKGIRKGGKTHNKDKAVIRTLALLVCVCVCVCCQDDFDIRENQERVCPSRENAHAQSTTSKLLTNLSY